MPRPSYRTVYPVACRRCGGPLVVPLAYRNRVVPIYVHARHRDWQRAPHTADPVYLEDAG